MGAGGVAWQPKHLGPVGRGMRWRQLPQAVSSTVPAGRAPAWAGCFLNPQCRPQGNLRAPLLALHTGAHATGHCPQVPLRGTRTPHMHTRTYTLKTHAFVRILEKKQEGGMGSLAHVTSMSVTDCSVLPVHGVYSPEHVSTRHADCMPPALWCPGAPGSSPPPLQPSLCHTRHSGQELPRWPQVGGLPLPTGALHSADLAHSASHDPRVS